jgi:hypothetical protein
VREPATDSVGGHVNRRENARKTEMTWRLSIVVRVEQTYSINHSMSMFERQGDDVLDGKFYSADARNEDRRADFVERMCGKGCGPDASRA